MFNWLLIIVSFVLSFLLTRYIRGYAIRKNIIDIPGHRSSHSTPTPRGGGLSFVIIFLAAALFISIREEILYSVPILGGSLLIAAIGFAEDHCHVPTKIRLLLQVVICTICMYGLDYIIGTSLLSKVLYGNTVLLIVFLIGYPWYVNLFNFMDGIDGIASMQAISTLLSGYVLLQVTGILDPAGNLYIVLAASIVGFLLMNFPPAKIFMGDVGSCFLGFLIASFTLHALTLDLKIFWAWIILSSVFVTDATFTVFKRTFFTRENIFQAHRTHAYQVASRKYKSHTLVTMAVLTYNVFFLFPVSLLVATGTIHWWAGMILGYIPTLLAVLYYTSLKLNDVKSLRE